jgi:hypothetical protein
MERYKVDERVGCIAILDTDIPTPSNGLHSDDRHSVKYWQGVNLYKCYNNQTMWHVPVFLRRRARKLCYAMNAIL